jgi:hypothetical protein
MYLPVYTRQKKTYINWKYKIINKSTTFYIPFISLQIVTVENGTSVC